MSIISKKKIFMLISPFIGEEKTIQFLYKNKYYPLWFYKEKSEKTKNINEKIEILKEAIKIYPESLYLKKNILKYSVENKTDKSSNDSLNKNYIEIEMQVLKNKNTLQILEWLSCFEHISNLFNETTKDKILNLVASIIKERNSLSDYERALKQCCKIAKNKQNFLLKLAELYQNNNESIKAYQYITIAALNKNVYPLLKKLSFEVDNKIDYSTTFNEIIENDNILINLGMLVRNIDFFEKEQQKSIISFCNKNIEEIMSFLKHKNKNKSFVRVRRLELALQLCKNYNYKVLKNKIDTIKSYQKGFDEFFDVATENSFSLFDDNPKKAIFRGNIISINQLSQNIRKVELAIPTAFYPIIEQKETYETIRDVFIKIFCILKNLDVAIIPFHQYNWRFYKRKIQGSFLICYHCFNIDGNNLIIQESQIPGKCSLDSRGFAGYSSICLPGFEKINKFIEGISKDDLIKWGKEYRNQNIERQVTKYSQSDVCEFDFQKPFIFIPLQIPTDIVSKLCKVQTIELIELIIDYVKQHKDKLKYSFVFKAHPYNNSIKIQNLINNFDDEHLITTSASIHKILSKKNCLAVLTANSGTGYEAMYYGKPVYVTGFCDYLFAASSVLESKEQIYKLLDESKFIRDDLKQIEFMYFYENFYTKSKLDEKDIKEIIFKGIKNV